jgi:hypothetical protein
MDVSDKFQQVAIFLAQNGLVTVLEKLSVPSILSVERHGVTGQKARHDPRYRDKTRSQQQMYVIRYKRPGKAISLGFKNNVPETV